VVCAAAPEGQKPRGGDVEILIAPATARRSHAALPLSLVVVAAFTHATWNLLSSGALSRTDWARRRAVGGAPLTSPKGCGRARPSTRIRRTTSRLVECHELSTEEAAFQGSARLAASFIPHPLFFLRFRRGSGGPIAPELIACIIATRASIAAPPNATIASESWLPSPNALPSDLWPVNCDGATRLRHDIHVVIVVSSTEFEQQPRLSRQK
jgi:hypothetical protein